MNHIARHSKQQCYPRHRGIARKAPAGFGAFLLLLIAALVPLQTNVTYAQEKETMKNDGIYSFTMKDIDGKDVPLEQYRGRLLLIVNTASECGYTPQYKTLEKLYRTYHRKGLDILGFPANNFGQQEPGTNLEIKEFCSTKFDVTFDMFEKISVKGDDCHPLYTYLTEQSELPGEIKWNFYKFLVDREGRVVARWTSKTDPMSEELITKVEEYLPQ